MTSLSNEMLSRRSFLRGKVEPPKEAPVIRPPWTNERDVLSHCTSCGDCIAACPVNILHPDREARPSLLFSHGECLFCGACANACDEQVFDLNREKPWSLKISIDDQCLLQSGVTCQLCTDVCDVDALCFDLRVRPSGAVRVDQDACTGCGACISSCPTSAIIVHDRRPEGTA